MMCPNCYSKTRNGKCPKCRAEFVSASVHIQKERKRPKITSVIPAYIRTKKESGAKEQERPAYGWNYRVFKKKRINNLLQFTNAKNPRGY